MHAKIPTLSDWPEGLRLPPKRRTMGAPTASQPQTSPVQEEQDPQTPEGHEQAPWWSEEP